MKLIIDIPEATYKMIKEMQKRNGTEYMNELESGVANGTPLPKGHGRLIDADALKKEAVMCPTVGNAETLLLDISDVEHAPTIIEADKAESEE